MLIKIVSGIYGHTPMITNSKGEQEMSTYVVPVTEKDPPIEVDEEKALDLISRGYAVAVDDNASDDAEAEETAKEDDPEANYEDMTLVQLKELLRERGIDFKNNISKAAAIKLLTAEDGPDLDVADVVE